MGVRFSLRVPLDKLTFSPYCICHDERATPITAVPLLPLTCGTLRLFSKKNARGAKSGKRTRLKSRPLQGSISAMGTIWVPFSSTSCNLVDYEKEERASRGSTPRGLTISGARLGRGYAK